MQPSKGVTAVQKSSQKRQQQTQPPRPTNSQRPDEEWRTPDRYELRSVIGTGSYGKVVEAYDFVSQRVVAIKRIGRVFEDLVDCKRILREISILNRLNHDNVVKVLDICVPSDLLRFDVLYLVLEIADSDLKKLFRTEVYLSELHIKTILYNLLVGMKYVHSAGILHRDLKPANCLVNQDCSVKICDFGLARTLDFGDDSAASTTDSSHQNNENLSGSSNAGGSNNTSQSGNHLSSTSEKSNDIKKQLTGHVVTRWYRAPELILLQESYAEAIDVWSIACIFAELLGMMKENIKNPVDRHPLFPGSCCFPLSPDQKKGSDYKFHTKGNRDQLSMIFNVLGTPSEDDIEDLEKDDAKKYIRIFPKRERTDALAVRYKGASADCVDLLQQMLVFNPKKRVRIDECVTHGMFKEIRNKESEIQAASKVRLPFDDWQNMDENQLRYAFLHEIQRYHPEVEIPQQLVQHDPRVRK